MMQFAWRMFRRELAAGELRLLFLALTVAVAAVSAVGFFTERVRLALTQESHQLLGGDLLLVADHPFASERRQLAVELGLQLAETQIFPSMVQANGQAQLADIKAVSGNYPLRGRLAVTQDVSQPAVPVSHGPAPGTVWLDQRLQQALRVTAGETLLLGKSPLRIAAILTHEPDRGINFFSVAPRLMMHVDDLPASGLLQNGSRLSYRLLFAGEATKIAAYKATVSGRLERGERLEDAGNARPEIRTTLDRAERFLGLASLMTVILAAVAVALSARRYLQRHLDACAVLRCLGMTQAALLRLHSLQFLFLSGLAAVLGCGIGYAAHFLLLDWLGSLLEIALPSPGLSAVGQGLGVAAVLLFGFAFPPLLQLAKVPTLRVLRRELGPAQPLLLGAYALGWLGLVGMMFVVAGDARLGAWVVGGFSSAFAIFSMLAWLAVHLLGRLRGIGNFSLRQGLANLQRHRLASVTQIVALALGLMALMLLTVTRGELLDGWRKSLPADAPNRFVINIQPDQKDAVERQLLAANIKAELSPMVRGRLLQIGQRPVSAASYPEDDRAQRLVEREFNLSWRADLPAGNVISAGQWFSPQSSGQGIASVESGLAKTLGIQVGDALLFSVAGQEVALKVGSLRTLSWDSMRVNFFVLTPPGVLDPAVASYITSFYLPADQHEAGIDLSRRFPNLSVIDLTAVLQQVQSVTGQVALAVQFVFVFTLVAGLIVLYASLISALDERRHELALLRALGARQGQLRQALLLELGATGGIAGAIAAAGAMLAGDILSRQVFSFELPANAWLFPAAMLLGAALSIGVGWLGLARLLRSPPMRVLRAA